MDFLSLPSFWTAMASVMAFIFWMIKIIFLKIERSNNQRAELQLSVENLKNDNIMKSINYLNEVMDTIKPMVLQHEVLMKQVMESVKMVGTIEKGLNAMSLDLVKKYDEFQQKLVNITVSFQKTMDRVDNMDKKMANLGRVIKL
jgi:hypothetical protein